jgi:Ca2+-binding EF-hand superfamily protein
MHGSMHGSVHGSGAAYPQRGHSPQSNGLYRPDNRTYQSASRQQSNTTPNILQDECRAWFIAIDQDGDGSLSADELRSALLNNGGLRFSVNTVKYLMGIFDRDGNDVITYDEFEPLWLYMNEYRQMFDSFDRDRDGRIDATELGSALAHYNIRVGSHVLEMLVRKYGVTSRNRPTGYGNVPVQPRLQMDLDQFVCASAVVRQMCDLYEKCKAGGRSQISRDEFLRAVISLP